MNNFSNDLSNVFSQERQQYQLHITFISDIERGDFVNAKSESHSPRF